jgi:hypothetical protein
VLFRSWSKVGAIRRMLEDFPFEISQRLICLVGSMGTRVVMQEQQWALGSTQPLTEMSTRNLPGGKKQPALGAENLAPICEPNF